MSFSGGVYTLPGPALVTGEVVSATENNQFRNDVAGAFNVTMLRNGTSTATANLPMGGYKLTGLGVATTSGDALSYGQAAVISDLTASGTVTISSGTANGVAYLNGSKVLTTGSNLVFDGSNLGLGVTPSAWGGGFKAMQYLGGSVSSQASGYLYTSQNAYYNGTNWTYSANGGAVQYEQSNAQHQWKIAGYGTAGNAITFTQAMTLDASGNLGIGTSSPSYKLDVIDTARINASANGNDAALYLRSGSTQGTTQQILFQMAGSGGDVRIQASTEYNWLRFTTAGSERMRIDSSGNLLLGTTTAASGKFTSVFAGSSTAITDYAFVGGSNSYQMIGLSEDTANNAIAITNRYSSGGNIIFRTGTGGTIYERMRIDSGGNLLVGTTSQRDVERLSVVGSSGTGILVQATNAGSNSYSIIFRNAANATVGSCYCTSTSTAYNTSSDYRLKENIQPMQNALDVVAQLKPVTYTWKADGSEGQGFIAHELQAVVPDCVTGEKDGTRIEEYEITPAVPAVYEEVVIPAVLDEEGNVIAAEMIDKQLVTAEIPAVMGEREVPVYQGIDTSFLVATLTKAIQELKAELDATKAEVAALKNTAA